MEAFFKADEEQVAVPVWLGVSQVNPIFAAVLFVIATVFLTLCQWGFQTILKKGLHAGPPVKHPTRSPILLGPLRFVLNLAVFVMPFFAIYLIAAAFSAR